MTDNTPIFINSVLDDFGLSPSEFRVYAHVARRSGRGGCNSSIESMSTITGYCGVIVRHALKVLTENNLLRKVERNGHTTIYYLTPPEKWIPLSKNDTPVKINPPYKLRGDPCHKVQGDPCQKMTGKGSPSEGSPLKVIQSAVALQFPLHLNSPKFHEAWKVWQEYYPKRVPKSKGTLLKTFQAQLNKLSEMTEAEAILSIQNSIANSWQGVFPPKETFNHFPKPPPAHRANEYPEQTIKAKLL